ncbi:MAG: alpha-glucosidase [Cryptosporangiaceae bacterium]|nr:alpha-glucosidase [Cryptosporangiaceae bacterium]
MRVAARSRTIALCLTAALAALLPPSPARAAELSMAQLPGAEAVAWTVAGPTAGDPVTAEVALDAAGALTFGVTHNGSTVLAPAPAGIVTTAADLTTGLTFLARADKRISQDYPMTTGKRLRRHVLFSESTFSFTGAGNTRVDFVVRVTRDGAAYRYVLPATGAVGITRESSAFTLPADAPAWLLPYTPNYEGTRYESTAAAAPAGDVGFPALFEATSGVYALLSESDVNGRYSGARLAHDAGSPTYSIKLDTGVSATGPLSTPWRTAIVGSLATVTGSTLTDDLAPWAKFTDTSWIRPGLVAWSWLSEGNSPRDPVRQKQFIDFAARNGWPYVLIDEGWSPDWVPEVTRYARARGVDVLLWFHWTSLDTAEERNTVLPQVKSWGVAGIKVDFMDSDSQARFGWYDDILAATYAQKLMINFHGATIPRGIQRTWPHVMSVEAIRGAEQYRSRAATNTMFPFTRNVVGSMDYTPAAFVVSDRDTTTAHELATTVVYESGWQHLSDKPENYEARPEALRTFDQLPTVWDDTRLLSGRPGQETVLARRSGERWFVGAIEAQPARTVTEPLTFLGNGRYLAETVRDDGSGGLTRSASVVTHTGSLSVPTLANGGFVTILCPYSPGLTTCDQPIRRVPATGLTVTPAATTIRVGTPLTVQATFTAPTTGPVTAVTLAPTAPAGWTASGATVTATQLAAGQSLSGTWQLTPSASAQTGGTDVPVAAEFRFPGDPADRPVHHEEAVQAFVTSATGTVYASDLPFIYENNGWGSAERDHSNGDLPKGDGRTITIHGTQFAKGIGIHAPSEIDVRLGGSCTEFRAQVGLDDEVIGSGSVEFQLEGDGKPLGTSGVVRSGDAPKPFTVDVTGVQRLKLKVTDGGDGRNFDHGDWADAQLTC